MRDVELHRPRALSLVMLSAALWTSRTLQVRLRRDGRWEQISLEQPYAIVGGHPNSQVRLSGAPAKCALLLATDYGILVAPLAADAVEEQWLNTGDSCTVAGWELKVDLEGGPPLADRPAAGRRTVEFYHRGECQGRKSTRQPLRIVGRRQPSHWRIRHSHLSGSHCALYCEGARTWVIDLLSTRGTRIDGRRVQVATLSSGQQAAFGDVKMRLVEVAGDPPDAATSAAPESTAPESTATGRLDSSLRAAQDEVRELTAVLEQHRRDASYREEAFQSLQEECTGLQTKLSAQQAELEKVRGELTELSVDAATAEHLAKLSERQQAVWDEQRADLEARVDEWKALAESNAKSAAESVTALEAAQADLLKLRPDFDAATHAIDRLQQQLAETSADRDRLQQQLTKAAANDTEQQEARANFEAEAARLEEQLTDAQAAAETAERAAAELQEELESLRERLRAEADRRQAEHDALAGELRAANEALEPLRAELSRREAEHDSLVRQLRETRQSRDKLEAELQEARSTCQRASTEREQLEAQLKAGAERIVALEAEADVVRAGQDEAAHQIHDAQAARDAAQRELAAVRAEQEAADRRLAVAESHASALEKEREAWQRQAAEAREQAETLAAGRREDHELIDKVRSQAREMEEELAAARRQLADFEEQLKRLQAGEMTRQRQAESAGRQLEAAQAKLAAEQSATEDARRQAAADAERIAELARLAAAAEERTAQLERELAATRAAAVSPDDAQTQGTARLRADLDAARTQLREARARIRELESKSDGVGDETPASDSDLVPPPPPPSSQVGVMHMELESSQMLAEVAAAENEELRDQLAAARAEVEALHAEAEATAAEHARHLKHQEELLHAARLEAEMFQADCSFSLERAETAAAENAELQQEVKRLQAMLESQSDPRRDHDPQPPDNPAVEASAEEDDRSEFERALDGLDSAPLDDESGQAADGAEPAGDDPSRPRDRLKPARLAQAAALLAIVGLIVWQIVIRL